MLTDDQIKELNNLFTFPPNLNLGNLIDDIDKRISNSDYKNSCRVATISNIFLSGLQIIDGVQLSDGDRVVVKNQIIQSQNGIYTASSGVWSRSEDANSDDKITSGLKVFSEEGSSNSGKTWIITTSNPIIIDTTPIVFSEFFSTPLSSSNPVDVNKSAASPGTASDAARSDHKHDVLTSAPSQGIGSGNFEGVSSSLSRSDHDHAIRESGGTDLTIGQINDSDLITRNGTQLSGINISDENIVIAMEVFN